MTVAECVPCQKGEIMSEITPPVGETLATPDCPPSVRTAIINHLSELYEQANLMHPQIVRSLYPLIQKHGQELKTAEPAAPKPASAPVPFPLSVAQAQSVSPAAAAIFSQPSQNPAPQPIPPAANPFGQRPAATNGAAN
jgi:hypothetical protein